MQYNCVRSIYSLHSNWSLFFSAQVGCVWVTVESWESGVWASIKEGCPQERCAWVAQALRRTSLRMIATERQPESLRRLVYCSLLQVWTLSVQVLISSLSLLSRGTPFLLVSVPIDSTYQSLLLYSDLVSLKPAEIINKTINNSVNRS